MMSLVKLNLVQVRALILANEMLAANFSGWGDSFPAAKSKAVVWLVGREPGEEALIDVYMPSNEREKFAELFQPPAH